MNKFLLIVSCVILSGTLAYAQAKLADYGGQAPAANSNSQHTGKDCDPCDSASLNPDYPENNLSRNTNKSKEAIVREILAGTTGSDTTRPGSKTSDDK